eukprot:1859804-Rhodomonas_salina.8
MKPGSTAAKRVLSVNGLTTPRRHPLPLTCAGPHVTVTPILRRAFLEQKRPRWQSRGQGCCARQGLGARAHTPHAQE